MAHQAPSRYLNRELSWLEFNQRVLDEALDAGNPLLERLKFLAITGANLDEFFMVRVGSLVRAHERGLRRPDPAGLTPDEQLAAILARARTMVDHQYTCWQSLEALLGNQGIQHVRADELTDRQAASVQQVFLSEVLPLFTPVAVRDVEDFPHLINHTLNLCVRLAPAADGDGRPRFAVLPFGRQKRRFLALPADKGCAFAALEDVVEMNIDHFFAGQEVLECAAFRISRNADVAMDDDDEDLVAELQEVLDARQTSDCVWLAVADTVSPEILAFLQSALHVGGDYVFQVPGLLALGDLMQLSDLNGFEHLKYVPWPPQPCPEIDPAVSLFQTIARRDVVLYHPYESYDPVVRLIEEAADDPDVLAIKQTLYRTSSNSPIVAALARAAQRGKYVTALVELKARFDEARNIEWARRLERAEVQVIYGVKGLKTHAKLCLIVRREPHGIQRYMHFGTGNYNENSARLYSDVSLMTCDEDLGHDATSFFNAITGYSQPQSFRKLDAAPLGLRDKLLEMIEAETTRRRLGQRAHIAAKLNSLVDPRMIDALYAASQAGVQVRLNVRGICCLRPGVPGLSENIEVVSIVDRYLEHARILYFFHGGDERLFISSADWMPRNLDRRVELLVPIEDTAARRKLITILDCYFRDHVKGRRITADGKYEPLTECRDDHLSAQAYLYREAQEAVRRAAHAQPTMFEPHRAPGAEFEE